MYRAAAKPPTTSAGAVALLHSGTSEGKARKGKTNSSCYCTAQEAWSIYPFEWANAFATLSSNLFRWVLLFWAESGGCRAGVMSLVSLLAQLLLHTTKVTMQIDPRVSYSNTLFVIWVGVSRHTWLPYSWITGLMKICPRVWRWIGNRDIDFANCGAELWIKYKSWR